LNKSSGVDLPVRRLSVKNSDLAPVVLPLLIGTVFHVTSSAALMAIGGSGAIHSNHDRRFQFTFPQSENNYGRQRGYVCLFDFREASEDAAREARRKFNFLKPTSADPVFLFLHPSKHARLIPWTEAPVGAMVIPYVETWYPGDVPLSSLTYALVVTIEPDDADSAFSGIMRQLHRDKNDLLDSGLVRIEAHTITQLKLRVEEWASVAREAGLEIDGYWDEKRVERTAAGYSISLHAWRPEHWHGPTHDSD
jgi:hypothetical protein